MKERIISLCLLLFAAITIWLIVAELPKKDYAQPASDFTEAIRNGIPSPSPTATSPAAAGEVIRLHILADSDSERDQALKLALRDVLLPHLNIATLNAGSKDEALMRLAARCDDFTSIANDFLLTNNAGYTATVSVQRIYFPIRIYGSQTYLSADAVIFPPGFYDSVQVVLGSGAGHNWWCLAYPSLCFIDSAYDYVPKDSDLYKQKIGTVKQDTLEKLFYGRKISPGTTESEDISLFFGFKFWELVKALFRETVQ